MITLSTLHLATERDVFDQVRSHLLVQRERSERVCFGGQDTICQYHYGSLRCAAGCLISDDEYKEEMEGVLWETLIQRGLVPAIMLTSSKRCKLCTMNTFP